MEAYAVIQTGGKQYRVVQGDVLDVERLPGEAGDAIAIDSVLAVSDGEALTTGTPNVDGATVKAEVVEHFRGPKLVAFKKKRRKGYTRKVGHRQELTKIKIVELA
ncbi:MAG: large subunit ribosomal protein L21 [Kiritimatiellia bacterium]|jgi:large subunit ribosomal protein L21